MALPPPGFFKRLALAGVNLLTPLHAGLIIVYFALRWLGGDTLEFIDALGYVLPWLFVPLVVLLPTALLCRSRCLSSLVSVPAVLFLVTYGHLYFPRWPVPTAGPAFTVMTYNVLNRNSDIDQIATVIEASDPDLVSLRELKTALIPDIESRFAEQYPYRRMERGCCGVLSRYPILDYETFQLGERWPLQQQFVLDVDGRRVGVLAVHLRPPLSSSAPSPFYDEYSDHVRDADVHTLLSRVEQIDGPLIVAGDLNLTDQHDLYGPLTHHLEDAHRESGWGMGFTFTRFRSLGLSLWRIDYVLHSPDLVALSTTTGEYGGSDHRPVIARLAFQ